MTTYESMDARILRLKVLALDVARPEIRETRRLTGREAQDLEDVLEELHRLHLAVAAQKAELEKLIGAPKAARR